MFIDLLFCYFKVSEQNCCSHNKYNNNKNTYIHVHVGAQCTFCKYMYMYMYSHNAYVQCMHINFVLLRALIVMLSSVLAAAKGLQSSSCRTQHLGS